MFLICSREKLSFRNLMFGKVENNPTDVAQQIFPTHRTFLKITENKFLFSENIVSQTQSTFICSNSAIISVQSSVKYIQN